MFTHWIVAATAAVGYCGILWGKEEFEVGLQVEGGELDLTVNAQYTLSLRSSGPRRQLKSQSSQPLFLFAPGPAEFSRVAVSTWLVDLLLHEALSCLYPTPWPCGV